MAQKQKELAAEVRTAQEKMEAASKAKDEDAIRTADWKLILNLHPEFAHTTHIDKALARPYLPLWYLRDLLAG